MLNLLHFPKHIVQYCVAPQAVACSKSCTLQRFSWVFSVTPALKFLTLHQFIFTAQHSSCSVKSRHSFKKSDTCSERNELIHEGNTAEKFQVLFTVSHLDFTEILEFYFVLRRSSSETPWWLYQWNQFPFLKSLHVYKCRPPHFHLTLTIKHNRPLTHHCNPVALNIIYTYHIWHQHSFMCGRLLVNSLLLLSLLHPLWPLPVTAARPTCWHSLPPTWRVCCPSVMPSGIIIITVYKCVWGKGSRRQRTTAWDRLDYTVKNFR